MSNSIDRTNIKLVLNREVTEPCYPSINDFFKLITEAVSGQAEGAFGEVILSNTEPSPDEVYKLWIRFNAQRNDFEQRLFINGAWRTWNFVAANEVRMFSGALPAGWTKMGTFKIVDVPITAEAGGGLPTELTLAKWTGY